MNARELLDEIFKTQKVTDQSGNEFKLNSNLDEKEGEFLKNIIHDTKPSRTIEVGCAFGISSLYICSELGKSQHPSHTIIDPYQSTEWKNIGIENLKRANINFFELIEKPSEIALPQLLSEGRVFDFAFIDGWHTFDHTLIDFFYLNRMITVGGVIVIDDVGMPGVNKLMRYLLNYPGYEMIGNVEIGVTVQRNLFDLIIKSPFTLFSKILPKKIKYEIFASKIIKSDRKLKLKSSMIALKKTKEDNRPWNWFEEF